MLHRAMLALVAVAPVWLALARETPSVAGNWETLGRQKVRVVLQGKKKSSREVVADTLGFNGDGSFVTSEGEWGTWSQDGNAFSVALDLATVEAFWQALLDSQMPWGMSAEVTVTSASLSGKINGTGTKVSGKLLTAGELVLHYGVETIPGTFSSVTAFKGPRAGTLKRAGPSSVAAPLLEALSAGLLDALVEAAAP